MGAGAPDFKLFLVRENIRFRPACQIKLTAGWQEIKA